MVDLLKESDDGEQDDETTDSSDTMSYAKLINVDGPSETTKDQSTTTDWDWDYSDHSTASEYTQNILSESIEATMDSLDEDVDEEMIAVLQEADELVEDISINKFECPHEDCGLGHNHPDWKHDITASTDSSKIRSNIPGFNIDPRFADQMEFQRNCHCGANEAAMLMKYLPYIDIPMFSDQQKFEGIFEIRPDHLYDVYRLYHENDLSVSMACGKVASRRGRDESEILPLGVRDSVEAYCERREQMEEQAQKAPISQETRSLIEENRDELEVAVNQSLN